MKILILEGYSKLKKVNKLLRKLRKKPITTQCEILRQKGYRYKLVDINL